METILRADVKTIAGIYGTRRPDEVSTTPLEDWMGSSPRAKEGDVYRCVEDKGRRAHAHGKDSVSPAYLGCPTPNVGGLATIFRR
jgi:hypothetical protein